MPLLNTTVTQSSSSVISPKMSVKSGNKTKKSKFDLEKFLIETHGESTIHKIDIPDNKSWHLVVKKNEVAVLSGMLFLVNKSGAILYIGQTNHIYDYVTSINSYLPNMKPSSVFVVSNSNPSIFVHAVTAYRAKFSPVYNAPTNTRFTFNPNKVEVNTIKTKVKSIDWIRANPNSRAKEFVEVFSMAELYKLCRMYHLGSSSYKALKQVILSSK